MKSASALHFLVLCACLFASPAFAQGSTTPSSVAADGRHTLNLKDADIQALIATVSEITGKNFILGPNVQGKVTVISAKPMKPDEIYDVFLSVLRVHGYAAISQGSMIKIVAEAMAQQDGSASLNGDRVHSTDELITQIVPVKHVAANDLIQILRPLMPQSERFSPHDFRRTARTHLEALGIAPHVAERCLNHKLRGVVGIYNRHDYFEERKEALQKWADLLCSLEDH